jgi:RimJ/RimL family protein N-acetyltransferase
MNADPDVARHLSLSGHLSAEDSWRQLAMFIGHWELRGFGMWAIAEVDRPDVLVGRVGAHQPEGWPDFEIGWVLARAYWGRGYATEGASAAMRYAFDVLERPRVVSLIHTSNARSRAVAERLGERFAGEWVHGEHRADIYEIDRETWSSSNRGR